MFFRGGEGGSGEFKIWWMVWSGGGWVDEIGQLEFCLGWISQGVYNTPA